ncbi:carbohydrate kinase [Arthrobacter livingstonensis]|uniref:Carbohydrate kinase n=1 Tax=Arthrobacter livingstonensis TaxID=670078 RepID=A0A2V5LAX6_9MICC|nr:carbohydrate kinase [Arthrobacter livingstonensis]PYI66913.1 carbohydrate kinase [Arthrobacter livingstonensis]
MLTVIGEALIDEVVRAGQAPVPHVGGSPLNVAVGLARLGHPVQFLGRFGRDAYGDMVAAHLAGNAVLVPVAPDGLPTSIARAVLSPGGAAAYEFALDWELPAVARQPDGAPNFMLAATTLLHTGSIATMLAPGAGQVFSAVVAAHPSATISYDPNCRPSIIKDVNHAREQAEKFVRLSDVVKASDEDLAWLYPGTDPKESARRWLAMGGTEGPAVVIVTQGGDGPWAVCAAGEAACEVPPTEVVDTVGAGDSFMAALLAALVDRELDGAQRRDTLRAITREQLEELIRYAARAAAITVSRAGANPPTRAELQKGQHHV